ncbi:unnamed protein product, partial [Closterium sp. Yama58-4]
DFMFKFGFLPSERNGHPRARCGFASSGFAALLVACLLSASGVDLVKAEFDWVSQLLPNYEAQTQSIMRQVARLNQTYYSKFTRIFASYFKSGDLVIDEDATILIPSNDGFSRSPKARFFDNLTRNQKLRILRYHILKGRYTGLELISTAPNTLFLTFHQNLPLNKTSQPKAYVYFEPVPGRVISSTGYVFCTLVYAENAGRTRNIAAHGVSMGIEPPNY